jgi:hypothetical protein
MLDDLFCSALNRTVEEGFLSSSTHKGIEMLLKDKLMVLNSTALLNPQHGYDALPNIWCRDEALTMHPANSQCAI